MHTASTSTSIATAAAQYARRMIVVLAALEEHATALRWLPRRVQAISTGRRRSTPLAKQLLKRPPGGLDNVNLIERSIAQPRVHGAAVRCEARFTSRDVRAVASRRIPIATPHDDRRSARADCHRQQQCDAAFSRWRQCWIVAFGRQRRIRSAVARNEEPAEPGRRDTNKQQPRMATGDDAETC